MRSLTPKLMMMGRNLMSRRRSSSSMKRCMMTCSNIYYHHHQNCTQASPSSFSCSSTPAYSFLQASPFCFLPESTNSSHDAEEEPQAEFDMQQPIVKGDMVNLNQLLFTKGRDYLVKYNDDRQVKAADLAGKVIVLYFLPLHSYTSMETSYLKDAYNYLLPENFFEVVLVAFGSHHEDIFMTDVHSYFEKIFELEFSVMPWTAIPFSDIKSRERLLHRFGIDKHMYHCTSVVVDSAGLILQSGLSLLSDVRELFERYGGLGYPYSDKKGEEEPKKEFDVEQPIKKGDMVNLNQLLFTKGRDYLVKNNDDRQVKAADLAGKVIVLYFLPLHSNFYPSKGSYTSMDTSYLRDAYNYLLPENVFEVVLVAYGPEEEILTNDFQSYSRKIFELEFSVMPWTAIPFSDIKSRERLVCRFGIDRCKYNSTSVVVDSTGLILQSDGRQLFEMYGGLGYPYSDKKSEVETTAFEPLLESLLGSPKRNYVISNKGDKVLIDSLKEKVVGIYFYEEGITPDWQTKDIMTVYEEFAQNKSLFEVVLIYLYDTNGTIDRTSETTFCNTFKTMPWLALPFKDPKCGMLRRIIGYPFDKNGIERAPTLVIIGPDGRFIEPWGADVIRQFKLPAFPFTREKVAMLDNEKVKELTLGMLWDRNTIFRRIYGGGEVRFSELFGKRIVIFFEGNGEERDEFRKNEVVNFLGMLKERCIAMINERDEFEVIYIANSKTDSPYNDHIVDSPFLISHVSELSPIDLSLYCCYCHLSVVPVYHICSCCKRHRNSSMLAFDEDGRVVRKSIELSFGHLDFPFYDGSMKKEAFHGISNLYGYVDADRYHVGIRYKEGIDREAIPINSYFSNLM